LGVPRPSGRFRQGSHPERQTKAFASALSEAGKLPRLTRYEGLNHFELMECFGDPGHALVRDILGKMGM
jgi:hypothetical protein